MKLSKLFEKGINFILAIFPASIYVVKVGDNKPIYFKDKTEW